MSDLNALKITDTHVTHIPTDPQVLHKEGVAGCLSFVIR